MDKIEKLISEAIEKRKMLRFDYEGHARQVEPHHYGFLNDSKQLHCYQVGNGSRSGGLPQWRNFRLDQIQNLSIEALSFTQRPDYNPGNSHYSSILKQITQN
jgi:predicted DNA-binding transcriptional regulator YafY